MNLVDKVLRSFENPATSLSDPDEWLSEVLGGGTTDTGVTINRKTALEYSPLWRAVHLLARDVARTPLLIYERLKPTGKARAIAHPAYYLLRYMPNERQTAFNFRQVLMGHALLQGNGYAYIFRRGDGYPKSLAILDPDVTYPLRRNGVLWYMTKVNGNDRKLRPHNVLHIQGLGFDGLQGYSLINKAKQDLGIGIATRKHVSQFFGHGAQPSVVLQHPGDLSEVAKQNIRESFEKIYTGIDNRFRVAVIEEGMTLQPWSINPEDAQLAQTQELNARWVSLWTGVPPHKLGDPARTSYKSLEQEQQSYLDEGVDPWYVTWESECWSKLLSEVEKRADSHVVEFLRAALIRTDMKSRYEALSKAVGGPWMSRNEARSLENMNPLDPEVGDALLLPAGVLETGRDEQPVDKPGQQRLRAAHRLMLVEALNRMAKRLGLHARRAARKGTAAYTEWLETHFVPDHFVVVEAAVAPCIAASLALSGSDIATASDTLTRTFFSQAEQDLRAATGYPEDHLVNNVNEITAAFPTRLVEPLVAEFEDQNHALANTKSE